MTIKIHSDNQIKIIEATKGQSLMKIFNDNNIELNFVCGGKGNCGKCKIQDIKNKLPITEVDKKFLTQSQLDKGYRLACKIYPIEDIEIKLIQEDTKILDYNFSNVYSSNYSVAIDIGTTTISMELINLDNAQVVNSCTILNSQKTFGADILSRIQNSINGNSEQLRKCIQNDILKGLKLICADNKINKIVIAANTTMIHLLMGFDCSGLGVYPFSPVSIEKIETSFYEIFESNLFDANVTILPSISTYIGADIVSGMLNCNFDKSEKNIMLIDIGTNGEIAVGNKNKILCTSAAAGPALEGGNISCGMGAVDGAISKLKLENDKIIFDTIGNKKAIGICGSAVIDIVSETLKNNLIDYTGLLKNNTPIEITENISFTQQDIRQVQLAKSAIYCSIDILAKSYNDIDTVYISGGFSNINIENAITVGIIPLEFKNKIKFIGNSSLNGAKKYILESCEERVKTIINKSKEIYLANESSFNDLFIKNLNF